MPDEEAFKSWQSKLSLISEAELRSPKMPIDVFCADAETLSAVCKNDKTQLLGAGLEWQYVLDLIPLSQALRYCQAMWMSEDKQNKEQIKYLQLKSEALVLKKELLRHYKYAFYHYPKLKQKLKTLDKYSTQKKLPLDLLHLVNLAKNHRSLLENINFDSTLTQQAHDLSHSIPEQLALSKAVPKSEHKQWRDRAYTLLSSRIKVIRECGLYIFHQDKQKIKRYRVNYYREYHSTYRKGI
ncbi:hypothetical protein [Carboxylicivirga sp. N1Y90]|uniref:hypothetical protein n=1 Tax=Carboxylicivirga fragile TaxID=3417571 RepID=UPI003D33B44E|nr:hypothetical protein [Marinilabiliaceae bacterium N1Y90]